MGINFENSLKLKRRNNMGYKNLLPSTVGFDRLLSTIDDFDSLFLEGRKAASYPPYNIVKTDDTNYTIEIAVAGFKRNDLDVITEGNKLTVSGKISGEDRRDYLHRGIGTRDFTHNFTLSDTVVVKSADIVNGLLLVQLENIIPEEKKPRKIEIGNELLLENGN